MLPINFNHLYYFWVVVRLGGISQAGRELQLSQPTVSAQLKQLERSLGAPLFVREGRRLALTAQGRIAFEYAEQMFGLGKEMTRAMQGHETRPQQELTVGIMDVLPKHLIYHFLSPATDSDNPIRLKCFEGKLDQMLSELSNHRMDVVFSDSPLYHDLPIPAKSALLGECGVVAMGRTELLAQATGTQVAQKIASLPVLLPTQNTALRRVLDRWFDEQGIEPRVLGEFEDSGLLKVFAMQGLGLCFVPRTLKKFLDDLYGLKVLGQLDSAKMRFYAITAERMVQHPLIDRLTTAARAQLASTDDS